MERLYQGDHGSLVLIWPREHHIPIKSDLGQENCKILYYQVWSMFSIPINHRQTFQKSCTTIVLPQHPESNTAKISHGRCQCHTHALLWRADDLLSDFTYYREAPKEQKFGRFTTFISVYHLFLSTVFMMNRCHQFF